MSVYSRNGIFLRHTRDKAFYYWKGQQDFRLRLQLLFACFFLLAFSSMALASRSLPLVTAKAALVVDAHTQKVYFSRSPFLRLPMASTTKIITALLTLEKASLQEKVTVSTRAATTPASKIYLKKGETISVEDLLYATLLKSANDASVALAESVAGSESQFAWMMTRMAHKLGAKNTRFANASGLPAFNHYSTAWDLALLMKHAIKNPQFVQIARTKTYVMDRKPGLRRHLRNHNKLLWQFPGAGAGKTGYTRAAGHCYVGTATRNGKTLIVVVLKSRNLWGDVQRLLEYGFQMIKQQSDIRVAQQTSLDQHSSLGEGDLEDDKDLLYTLQVGAFRDKASAQRLHAQLQKSGHESYIVESELSDGLWYRVRMGTYANIEEAKAFAQQLPGKVIIVPLEDLATQ